MATNDGFMRFTSVSEIAERGRPIEGSFVVDGARQVRGLRVELVTTQLSASLPAPKVEVTATHQVSGATALDGGERFTFSVGVPDSAVPGFTTPNGSLTWSVKARADVFGGDPSCVQQVLIAPAPPERRADLLAPAEQLAAVAEATSKRTEADQRSARWLGWLFAGFGLVFVVLGARWAVTPPEKWDGSRTGLWPTFGFAGFFGAIGVLLLWVNRRRTCPVTVETDGLGFRPGQPLVVTASNPTNRTWTVGLQEVEIRARVRGSGKSAKYDSPQEVLSNEWRDLPPGDHRLAFTVGAEARPSFGGATIAVAHRVVVVPHGNTNPRRPALEHHIVVIR